MKIILCFLLLAGLVALIYAAPDGKADAAKADLADKSKDAAKNAKDATEAPAKLAKDIANDAKKAEKDTEKGLEKGAKDCLKPDHGKNNHPGPLSVATKTAENLFVGAEEFGTNLLLAGYSLFGL